MHWILETRKHINRNQVIATPILRFEPIFRRSSSTNSGPNYQKSHRQFRILFWAYNQVPLAIQSKVYLTHNIDGKDTRLWNFSVAQRYYKENIVNPDIAISQGLLYSLWISLCRRKIPQACVFTLTPSDHSLSNIRNVQQVQNSCILIYWSFNWNANLWNRYI